MYGSPVLNRARPALITWPSTAASQNNIPQPQGRGRGNEAYRGRARPALLALRTARDSRRCQSADHTRGDVNLNRFCVFPISPHLPLQWMSQGGGALGGCPCSRRKQPTSSAQRSTRCGSMTTAVRPRSTPLHSPWSVASSLSVSVHALAGDHVSSLFSYALIFFLLPCFFFFFL